MERMVNRETVKNRIITVSREFGSGGRTIAGSSLL